MARSRTSHRDYCMLCGIRIVRFYSANPSFTPWDGKIRALCFDENTRARPFLTGVGYLHGHMAVADDDASVPYTDPGAVLARHRLTPDDIRDEKIRLVFGVHDACWGLLLSRIAPIAPDEEPDRDETEAVVVHLYNVLFSLFNSRHKPLDPARDFGGKWRFHIRYPRSLREDSLLSYPMTEIATNHDGDLTEEWAFLLADPLQTSIGNAPPQALPPTQGLIRDSNDTGDFFVRIPRELVLAVLAVLPSADICSLRLASRRVASLSSPASLPVSFWRSRFAHGFEMAFYMAGYLPDLPSKDWRQLYGQIRHCLAHPTGYEALCNRRRIWYVFGDLCLTLEALLQGSPAMQTSISYAALKPLRRGMAARVRRPLHENPSCPPSTFTFAWDPEEAFSSSPVSISTPIKVSTSFIHFDGRPFICGIRATASTPAVTLSQVGLVRCSTEQHFYLQREEEITKVRVICSASGVVGMKFFIQTTTHGPAESGTWQSVGITSMSEGDLGVAELTTSGKILGLTLGFDACKCISVGVLGPCDGDEPEPTGASPLWFPDIPDDFQFTSQETDQNPSEGESKYCLNIDFGGPRGERLPLLNRVTPFLGDGHTLTGIAFFYDDGTELVFGSRLAIGPEETCRAFVEPSIPIRGSAGERIIRIDCRGGPRAFAPRSSPHFQIETNMGVRTPRGRPYVHLSSLEGSLKAVSPGNIITGLFAEMKGWNGFVERLDARYISGDTDLSPIEEPNSVAISEEHQRVSWSVRYTYESSESGVKLDQALSIHFSRGDDGRCRSRHELCGMLVRFRDSNAPLIIGQWIRDIEGFYIELQQGERLTEIDIWYSLIRPSWIPPREPRLCNFGRVAGIRLVTSRGQVKEMRPANAEDMFFVQHRENPFEEIVGLVWHFNRQWEFIQLLRRPPLAHAGTNLVPDGLVNHEVPNRNLCSHRETHDMGKLFWREMDPQTGMACDLVSIDAFFFHRPGRPGRPGLVGMRFNYTHGVERDIGNCTAGPRIMMESVQLGGDEITYIERSREDRSDFYAWENQDDEDEDGDEQDEQDERDARDSLCGMRFSFYFASGRVASLPAQAEAVTETRDLFVLGTDKSLLEKADAMTEDGQWNIYVPPARSRCCVGLWIRMRLRPDPTDWVSDLGPLFLCEAQDK